MSETPEYEPSSATEEVTSTAPAAPTTPKSHAAPEPVVVAQPSKASRWVSLAALVIAVLAIAGAAVGWFYPHKTEGSAGNYTEQQHKDAKKSLCEALGVAEHAVARSMKLKKPQDGGQTAIIALVTTQQFAFYGSGAYVRDQVNENPASPAELVKPANDIATDLEQLGIKSLAGSKEFAQEELLHGLGDKFKAVGEICKK